MRRILAIGLGGVLMLQAGCSQSCHSARGAEREGGRNRCHAARLAAAYFPASNLAFGAVAGDASVAQEFAERSSWPSLDDGYVLQDESSQSEFIWDNQVFFDSLGGVYWRNNLVTSTRMRVR